jgi:hypothetical protein
VQVNDKQLALIIFFSSDSKMTEIKISMVKTALMQFPRLFPRDIARFEQSWFNNP